MSEPQDNTAAPGCAGGVLTGLAGGVRTGLIGAVIGFTGGFLSLAAFVPFLNDDAAGWLLFGALMVGSGSAFVGGVLGIITGTIGGTRAALRAAVTKGVLGVLIGAVIGFIAGFLVAGLALEFSALESVEAGGLGAFYGGVLGFIMGTIVGTWQAARKQRETKASGVVSG
jgi:hypothetical protein